MPLEQILDFDQSWVIPHFGASNDRFCSLQNTVSQQVRTGYLLEFRFNRQLHGLDMDVTLAQS